MLPTTSNYWQAQARGISGSAAFAVVAYVFSLHVLEVFEEAELSFMKDFFNFKNFRRMVLLKGGVEA